MIFNNSDTYSGYFFWYYYSGTGLSGVRWGSFHFFKCTKAAGRPKALGFFYFRKPPGIRATAAFFVPQKDLLWPCRGKIRMER